MSMLAILEEIQDLRSQLETQRLSIQRLENCESLLQHRVNDLGIRQLSLLAGKVEWRWEQGVDDWTNLPNGLREVYHVTFPKPFARIPDVHIGLSHIDTGQRINWEAKGFPPHLKTLVATRVHAEPRNISEAGFDLHILSWADTCLFGCIVHWLALTNSLDNKESKTEWVKYEAGINWPPKFE